VTRSIAEGSWVFRQFDTNDDLTPYRFRFRPWVRYGDRTDLAAVEFLDEWSDWEGVRVAGAVFAARHAGVDLRALPDSDLPAHVHLLTTSPQLIEGDELPIEGFRRTAWATIGPEGWQDPRGMPGWR
jgi:hypothetical protein